MTEVRIPKPGDAITEAEVTEFFVEEGATVSEGEPLYSIATDKVEMDIEAPASGTVSWKVSEGGTYDIGALVAVIS
ncbi:biotin/lipoyl-containing protein [Mycolicibacterium iranicum]|jgi:2-oxoglutarate dehydrogenase E2 component (dihydrolipoamide succinyltransferase)|uniref:Dihydrolipoamide acyltransferase n=1 Tax=Mycolicibacterium iranicum TaxID=912594 RepID=A0A1X1WI88_MYCIR|nr:lipoyl domain-containing protein [Mycolicibacterium iranicum]ORV86222.1 dihydrolipoamide acyltransferase [Mycolicibacterium iranicum]